MQALHGDLRWYYLWLFPSIISFSLSLLLIFNVLFTRRLRIQYFQRLSALLAFTDLLQSGAWFLGDKYRQEFHLCALQEYIFQFGAISKAFVTVIICGLALYITKYTKSPPKDGLKLITCGILLIPVAALCISINLKTARVYCTYEGSLPYKDSSQQTQLAVLAYSMTIILPIYLCVILDTIFSALLFHRVRGLDAAAIAADAIGRGSSPGSESAQLNTMVIRMQLYPIIVVLSWLPNSFLYILANAYGIRPMFLRIAAVLSLASSGIGISMNYFYHQRTYPPFVHHFFGFANPIERQSILHTGGEIESSFGSWSELEGSHSSTTYPRQTTVTTGSGGQPRDSSSSQPSGTATGRSYSLARKLLPRFDFRSHSSGNPFQNRAPTPNPSGSQSSPTSDQTLHNDRES
jgi:hypothetical protein